MQKSKKIFFSIIVSSIIVAIGLTIGKSFYDAYQYNKQQEQLTRLNQEAVEFCNQIAEAYCNLDIEILKESIKKGGQINSDLNINLDLKYNSCITIRDIRSTENVFGIYQLDFFRITEDIQQAGQSSTVYLTILVELLGSGEWAFYPLEVADIHGR